jgi:hypothetical protein
LHCRPHAARTSITVQFGWAAKILNIYLKTFAYVGDGGRPNLRPVLHPPIDGGLWRGVRQRFCGCRNILDRTHCVQSIAAIDTHERHLRIIGKLRLVADQLGCVLIEVEQLWAGTEVSDEA